MAVDEVGGACHDIEEHSTRSMQLWPGLCEIDPTQYLVLVAKYRIQP